MTWRRVVGLALAGAILGCSSLGEDGTAVAIETLTPVPAEVEINDTIPLRARVLDQNGDSIGATIRWRTLDTAFIGVDSVVGRIWGRAVGTGKVQATTGSLASAQVAYTVKARADTLIVAPTAESLFVLTTDSVSADLAPKIAQADGTGLQGRRIIISIVAPSPVGARLTGNVTVDTVLSAASGLPATPIRVRKVGVVSGDSVIVQVEGRRISGAVVPGSGRKIRVLFQ